MNKNEIYDYQDYKRYLTHFLKTLPNQGHGFRSRMAEAAGCRVAFVSQVLNGSLHFSLEQAEGLNALLNHSSEESDFFLSLIQYGRAGTEVLRNRLKGQISRTREKRLVLKERVDIKTSLSLTDQATYYSSWHYAAIHILVTIEKFQTKEAIYNHLKLSPKRVALVIEFLCSVGLIQLEGHKLHPGVTRLFLGSDSPMISRHHINWRMRAIESLDREVTNEIHLSTLMSFSKRDLLRMREQIVKGIEDTRSVARESTPEEELYCFNVDFFKI